MPIFVVAHVVGLGIEFWFAAKKGHAIEEGFLVSGALIPLIMPPDIPLWILAVSVAFAVIIGKEAFGGTGIIFLGLSGYALTSKRDFSFMGGFLFAGMMVLVLAMIANIFLQMPALSLAVSGGIILVMSGFILFDTSRIISGGETNYIMATYGLYLSIFNIFISLLNILGIMGDE